ncbi:hypothetical protein EJD97_020481 [Solanum chilense]|uniref:SET domain-containing protein n=1 Tax=Solanum chilense TaxID=4083 RepID=A0A6N2C7T4_SOLCI|nr:hypothetical protein EJD97_020481 [Solanum chilense]
MLALVAAAMAGTCDLDNFTISLRFPSSYSIRFQKCEYAKTKLFRTAGRGWGLSADENIKAGQFIMEYCGEVLSSEAAKKRCLAYEAHKIKDAYIMSLNANYFIDATKKGSLARFINHSCQPNCETRKWIVLGETRVGIFAKRDISVGMELSYNYNFEWYGGAPVHCLCGAANCSLFLGAKSQGYMLPQECSNVLEEGDNRHIVENLPLYGDESSPLISGTSGGNEHTKILNDGEGSTFHLEPTNSATKKKSQRKAKLKRLKNC